MGLYSKNRAKLIHSDILFNISGPSFINVRIVMKYKRMYSELKEIY